MLEIKEIAPRIFHITLDEHLSPEAWDIYTRLIIEKLSNSEQPIYFLSDFRKTAAIDSSLLPEMGKASYLNDPNMGMIIALVSSTTQHLVAHIGEVKAVRKNPLVKLRVLNDYDIALNFLQELSQNSPIAPLDSPNL